MYRHFLNRLTNPPEIMNVISLHSDHKQVSTTYVAIFRLVRTRIQLQLQLKCVGINPLLNILQFMDKFMVKTVSHRSV
jgi:hypothetical protein